MQSVPTLSLAILLVCAVSIVPLVHGAPSSEDTQRPNRPHVIFFVIDDLGWTDVGYRNGSGVSTPTIDALAADGVVLDKYYLQPVCSPSRSAMMQGRFPYKQGMQHYNTIMPTSYAAMPLSQPTMAELFRDAGYATRAVGKWHLGYASWKNTPTGRGFSSHKGYFQGEIDYYTKKFTVPKKFFPITIAGLDWWANQTAVKNESSVYNKDLYDEAMQAELDAYTPSRENPMFMYYAHQIAHVPLENPPEKFMANCTHITDANRKTYCAMLAAVDDSLRILVEALKAKNMWNDTVLVVTTDNGAMPAAPNTFPPSAGSNYPLRAGKGTLYEGGVRGIGFVQGGDNVLPQSARGTVRKDLTHCVDWVSTLVPMAGGNATVPSNVDGLDLWPAITGTGTVNRTALPLNINQGVQFPDKGYQIGVLSNGWKMILEKISGPVLHYDGWFPPPPAAPIPAPNNTTPNQWLFNLNEDPNEHNNLFAEQPDKVAELQGLLQDYLVEYQPPQENKFHFRGIPLFHDDTWSPFEKSSGDGEMTTSEDLVGKVSRTRMTSAATTHDRVRQTVVSK